MTTSSCGRRCFQNQRLTVHEQVVGRQRDLGLGSGGADDARRAAPAGGRDGLFDDGRAADGFEVGTARAGKGFDPLDDGTRRSRRSSP
jgi:hypothetical protein